MKERVKFELAIDELRKVHPELNLNYLKIFSVVSNDQGCPIKSVIKSSGLTKSILTRALLVLSENGDGGKPGLGLLRIENDYNDARVKRIYLTPKGLGLIENIENILK